MDNTAPTESASYTNECRFWMPSRRLPNGSTRTRPPPQLRTSRSRRRNSQTLHTPSLANCTAVERVGRRLMMMSRWAATMSCNPSYTAHIKHAHFHFTAFTVFSGLCTGMGLAS